MLYAVMSDVHANSAALAAAVADAHGRGCGRFVMLGDVTGYGYDVRGALEIVRKTFDVVLRGNHDSACVGLEPAMEVMLNRNYRVDVQQREELTDEERDWLRTRPYLQTEGDIAFVHGDFTCPAAWNYIFSERDAVANFFSRTERVMFCGHTHHAAAWEMTMGGFVCPRLERHLSRPAVSADTRSLTLKEGRRLIVNVGSVGHPRRDHCSTYVIYDSDVHRVTFRRLPIDIAAYFTELDNHGIDIPFWLYDAIRCIPSSEG